jgi:hypothetical protein
MGRAEEPSDTTIMPTQVASMSLLMFNILLMFNLRAQKPAYCTTSIFLVAL